MLWVNDLVPSLKAIKLMCSLVKLQKNVHCKTNNMNVGFLYSKCLLDFQYLGTLKTLTQIRKFHLYVTFNGWQCKYGQHYGKNLEIIKKTREKLLCNCFYTIKIFTWLTEHHELLWQVW